MEELIARALAARGHAYAPYSGFRVGAAVRALSGTIYDGCNVENASYGMSNCAERTAVFSAICAGESTLETIVVVADTPNVPAPCGACRQVLAEFGVQTVIMVNLQGERKIVSMQDLLPMAFTRHDLPEGGCSHDQGI